MINGLMTSQLAFLANIRGSQLFIILVVILLLFGAKRLPSVARGVGKAIREFRRSTAGLDEEFRDAIDGKPEKNTADPQSNAKTENQA